MLWGEQVTDVADSGRKVCEGSRADLSQMGLQLSEGHFDGVQVGAVVRQIQEPAPMDPQCGGGFTVFVRREIVADQDSSRLDLEHQDLPDIRCKRFPVIAPLMTQGAIN